MNPMPRVGVVGGSIGGLTAALVLRDLGCEVDVFERSGTALEARGAGIGLHPMTTRYFDESSELDAARVEIDLPWLQFLDASGERIHRERMNYRFSSWNTIYRGLVRCFDDRRYHLGAEVADFGQDEHGVTIAEILYKCPEPFVQVIYDIDVPRMAFGRIALIGDAAFAVRPHAAAGTAKACADGWALRDALRDAAGDPVAALSRWEPGQLALGQQLLQRTREMGDRSQFHQSWVPGDPSLRLGLYGPGR